MGQAKDQTAREEKGEERTEQMLYVPAMGRPDTNCEPRTLGENYGLSLRAVCELMGSCI